MSTTTPRPGVVGGSNADVKVGEICEIHGDVGVIKFVGSTSFAAGKWIGVELNEPKGKNDGSVQGQKYFECKLDHGVFVRPSQVKVKVATPPKMSRVRSVSSQGSTSGTSGRTTPATASTGRFAPAQDPNLSAAQQRVRSSSQDPNFSAPRQRVRSSSPKNLVPSKLSTASTPTSRIGRLGASAASRLQTPQSRLATPGSIRRPMTLRMPTVPLSTNPSPTHTTEESNSPVMQESSDEISKEETEKDVSTSKTVNPFDIKPDVIEQPRQDQTVPQHEYDSLLVKLRILEAKRADDRERLRDAERTKQEADQFLSIRPKLQAKMNEMANELKDLRKELKEIHTEKENLESRQVDINDTLEMITLDKEMAEEKAEALQYELESLKERLEEVTIEVEILKENRGDLEHREITDEEKSSLAYIQLERQNDRMREALIRLRDITNETETELNRKVKDLEAEVDSMQEMQSQYDQISQKLATAESQIEDLKQQLDAALGAEDMLEELTEKNLALGDKVEELKAVVEDLEALQEVSNELEEGHVETEKQMQSEIDYKDMVIREQEQRLSNLEEANMDYDGTIQQFRELVNNLQNDLDVLRRKTENQQTEAEQLSSQSQAMMSLNHKLQTSSLKAQGKVLELELRKLDTEQALEKLKLIYPYLPEVFSQTESEAVTCFLLLRRVVFKSELVISHIDQIHNISEKLSSVVPENLIGVAKMRIKLARLSDMTKAFISFMSMCDGQSFIKLGSVFHELVGTERRLDAFIELLRGDQLREVESIKELDRSLSQIEHLTSTHLSNSRFWNDSHQFVMEARTIDFGLDQISVTFGYLKQAIALLCKDSEIVLEEGMDQFNLDFFAPMQTLITLSRSAKVQSRKVIRALDDASTRGQKIRSDQLCVFEEGAKLSKALIEFTQQLHTSFMAIVNEKRESKGELSISRFSLIISNLTQGLLQMKEPALWQGSIMAISNLSKQIGKMSDTVIDGDLFVKVSPVDPPWVVRANEFRAQVHTNADFERKLQHANEEIKSLLKQIKGRDVTLDESNVKVELLERRMEAVKRQTEQIAKLEEDLVKSKTQEKTFEEAMDSLRTEMDTLEQETNRLRQLVAKYEKHGVTPTDNEKSDDTTKTILPINERVGFRAGELENQLQIVTNTLRYLRAENEYLRSRDFLTLLGREEIDVPVLDSYSNSSSDSEEEVTEISLNESQNWNSLLKSATLEARSLKRDIAKVTSSPRVVDLRKMMELNSNKTSNTEISLAGPFRPGWRSARVLPDYQYDKQQFEIRTLHKGASELNDRLRNLKQKGLFENYGKPPMNADPVKIGRIHIASNIVKDVIKAKTDDDDPLQIGVPIGGFIKFETLEDIQGLQNALV